MTNAVAQHSATALASDWGENDEARQNWLARHAAIHQQLQQLLANSAAGYTGTVTTAKLTTGGTEGAMVFVNGILVSQTAAS